MKSSILIFLISISLSLPLSVAADDFSDPKPINLNRIYEEPYLYPAGLASADVLRKGEWLLAANGWFSYGAKEDTTLTLDWLLAVVAVPAGYIRQRLPKFHPKWETSLELYFISFFAYNEVKSVNDSDVPFIARQRGYQTWLHWNTTYKFTPRFRWHTYAGATYDSYQKYEPRPGRRYFEPRVYKRYVHPDVGTGFDWIVKPWLRVGANIVYGNSFYFFDQNPQRWAFQASWQALPFRRSKRAWLRNLRIEFFGGYVEFPELDYDAGIIPIYPLIMWQW